MFRKSSSHKTAGVSKATGSKEAGRATTLTPDSALDTNAPLSTVPMGETPPESIVEIDSISKPKPVEVQEQLSNCLIVGEGVFLEASVKGCESMVVCGDIKGEIEATLLEVSKKGRVQGTVKAEMVVVSGSFEGMLEASGSLEIRSTGKVMGTISFGAITVENGGKLGGRINIGMAKPLIADQSDAGSVVAPSPSSTSTPVPTPSNVPIISNVPIASDESAPSDEPIPSSEET